MPTKTLHDGIAPSLRAIGKNALSIAIAGLFVQAPPVAALPAGGTSEDIPVTDPVLLTRMGVEPDATNVYATEQAILYLQKATAEWIRQDSPLTRGQMATFLAKALGLHWQEIP